MRSRTHSTHRARTLAVSAATVTLIGAALWMMFGPVLSARGVRNPLVDDFRAGNLSSVRVHVVGIGNDLLTSKRDWFELPLDVWADIAPLAEFAHFTTRLPIAEQPGLDLAEIELTSTRGPSISLRVLLVDGDCSCFIVRHDQDVFVYKNPNTSLTTHFLSHVAMNVFTAFQDGDTKSARERSHEELDLLRRVAKGSP